MPISGFRSAGPPVGEADLAALERALGVALPPAYRAFLLRTNGGWPEPEDAFPFGPDDGEDSLRDEFFRVNSDNPGNTIARNRERFRGRVPPELLPVAQDPRGNLVCIGIEGKRYGKLYFWRVEDEADDELSKRRPYYGNIRRMAHDFDDLLNIFYDDTYYSHYHFGDPDERAVDEAEIEALEQQLGVELPPHYRAFLRRTNGDPPPLEESPSEPDPTDFSRVDEFFHVDAIARKREGYRGRGLPPEFLPVGDTEGGDLVCLGIEGKRYGKLYFWSMDDEADNQWLATGKPCYRNMWKIADDFDEFLESFYVYEEPPAGADDAPDAGAADRDDEPWPRTVSPRGTAIPITTFHVAVPPVDEADVAAVERALGVALPPEYRAFLLLVNGGRPEPENAFPLGPDHPAGRMFKFFHIEGRRTKSRWAPGHQLRELVEGKPELEKWMERPFGLARPPPGWDLGPTSHLDGRDGNSILRWREYLDGRVPPEYLPVGDAMFSHGGVVCIGIAGERYGKVYYWNKQDERYYDSWRLYYGNIWEIAPNFDEFLAGFHEPPPRVAADYDPGADVEYDEDDDDDFDDDFDEEEDDDYG